jgi:allantoate deiminase
MSSARISATRLHKTITELSKIGRQPEGGITRLTFSKADVAARNHVSDLIRHAGMSVKVDEFGNIIGRTLGASKKPTIACGSHIDTVPNGGKLDGAYGVLSAIEAIRSIQQYDLAPNAAFQIIVFTEEEGARFGAFIGSRGFTGLLTKSAAYALQDKNGITFKDAMREANIKPNSTSRDHTDIKSYVELHIEQGPILEREHVSIGVVDSIVGLGELEIGITGEAGHAGTTPMQLRRDALAGAARIIIGVNEIACEIDRTAVATVGSVDVFPGASNVIPGHAVVTVDFRDTSLHGMRLLEKKIITSSKLLGDQYGLQVTVRRKNLTKPTKMSKNITRIIEASSRSLGVSYRCMPSGAGHDCQNIANITKTGMIFVPSHKGMSHVPHEYTRPKQLETGANTLLQTLLRLAD